jgi:hypothetical protein
VRSKFFGRYVEEKVDVMSGGDGNKPIWVKNIGLVANLLISTFLRRVYPVSMHFLIFTFT